MIIILVWQVPLTDTKSISGLPDSLGWWFRSIFQEQPDAILGLGFGYVDVVDCAAALVAALQKDNVGGERIIISAGACRIFYVLRFEEARERMSD